MADENTQQAPAQAQQTQQQSGQQTAQPQQGQAENNPGTFDLNGGNMWEAPKEPGAPQSTQQQPTAQPQQGNSLDGFNDYVKGLNLFQPMTQEVLTKMVREGDAQGVNAHFDAQLQNVYRQAMLDSANMMNKMKADILQEAIAQGNQNLNKDKALTSLQTAIPLARNPNVAPVAQAVFAQHLKSGKTQEQAIAATRGYFQAMGTVDPKQLGLDAAPRRAPQYPGQGSQAGNVSEADMIDWMSFAKDQ